MRKLCSTMMLSAIVSTAGPAAAGEGEGTLDKDLIRRIVRAHIPEIRYCYNEGLQRDPDLAGALTVDFEIAPTGDVVASEIHEGSTLKDAAVEACIAAAVMKWKFPKPDGGHVLVSYPFVLEPG